MTDKPNPLDGKMPDDPLMAGAWFAAIRQAIRTDSIMEQFRADTGLSWVPPCNGLEQMIDDATGHADHYIAAFADWFNAAIWGDPHEFDGEGDAE